MLSFLNLKQEKTELLALFNDIDKDCDGIISFKEMGYFLH